MRRATFSSSVAWWLVLALLYGLLLWNAALTSAVGHLTGLLNTVLLAGLLYLIYSAHFLARRALQLWAFLALVFPSVFKIISKILIANGDQGTTLQLSELTSNLVMFFIGMILLSISLRFIRVEWIMDEKGSDEEEE